MPHYLFEGDDHERETVEAGDETDARELVADVFNERYGPGRDDDTGTPYSGDEFDLIAATDDDDIAESWTT